MCVCAIICVSLCSMHVYVCPSLCVCGIMHLLCSFVHASIFTYIFLHVLWSFMHYVLVIFACMCVHLYMHSCICVHVFIRAYASLLCVVICVYLCVYAFIFMCVIIHVCMLVFIHACVCASIFFCASHHESSNVNSCIVCMCPHLCIRHSCTYYTYLCMHHHNWVRERWYVCSSLCLACR